MHPNLCENNGQCAPEIRAKCGSLFQEDPTYLRQQWGYTQLSDCLNDPRQVPLKCQPHNAQLYCDASAAAAWNRGSFPQQQFKDMCLAQVNAGTASFSPNSYNCFVNPSVQSLQDFQNCLKAQPQGNTRITCLHN